MSYDPLTADSPGLGLDHMPSYWSATAAEPAPDDGPLTGTLDTEVAIIGAGYTGLSCAYHLARDYGLRATVIEANRPGWGCSGRNGGFARAAIGRHSFGKMIDLWGRDTARRAFGQALAAVKNVRTLIRDGGIACDALEAGHLKIAHLPSRAPALAREAELLQREFEYPAEFLSAAQLQSDHIGGTQAHGALRFPDAIAVHPLKLSLGVLRIARACGARVHGASPVLSWNKAGATHVLKTPEATVRAANVVLATNGYTPEHLHDCVRATTLPALSHIIVTRPMTAAEKVASGFVTKHVLTDTRNLLYYWRRLPDERILFGGRGRITETQDGQAAQREFLLSELKAKFPALNAITVDYDWWGWVCLTADFLPHVHHAADDRTVRYAIGYQGSGVSYALYAGKLLAARIAGVADELSIPSTATPLPRFPFATMRRIGQRAMYRWYRYVDNRR
ncbi:MAG TPA: FAD-binding oxidoreductase [Burkholderiales bacterium]|nr:FAD-binding oxidoreductase [Burkholderiales bacterium]